MSTGQRTLLVHMVCEDFPKAKLANVLNVNITTEVTKIMSKIMILSLPVTTAICSSATACNCTYLYHNLAPEEI